VQQKQGKQMDYREFFWKATADQQSGGGVEPFPYQSRLARDEWPDVIEIEIGLHY
jgi:hypothetical protein